VRLRCTLISLTDRGAADRTLQQRHTAFAHSRIHGTCLWQWTHAQFALQDHHAALELAHGRAAVTAGRIQFDQVAVHILSQFIDRQHTLRRTDRRLVVAQRHVSIHKRHQHIQVAALPHRSLLRDPGIELRTGGQRESV
jgi:hypothetical protein